MKHEGYREQRRLPGVQMTEVEVHMATYSLSATDHASTAGYPQARRWLWSLQVRAMHKRHL